MKIVSIDVGIKNLSFCLIEIKENKQLTMIKWDIIDLSEKNDYKCIEIDKNGLCDKPAKFIKDTKCYCLKHSKKQTYLQPISDLKEPFLKKQKIQSLIEIADKYKVKYEPNIKKNNLINLLVDFSNSNCFEPIQKNNATKIDLVTIGRNIQHKFDEIFSEHLNSIDIIIIENQIGPIANKMKTIQGMLAQYFIMKNNNVKIEFISAINKLKDFTSISNSEINIKEKLDYKQRKKLGIQVCSNLVSTDHQFKDWETFMSKHQKKDDLSDSFLQCMWYIKNKI
jgi:hypothetical protein